VTIRILTKLAVGNLLTAVDVTLSGSVVVQVHQIVTAVRCSAKVYPCLCSLLPMKMNYVESYSVL
jgi:hypothetical protein